MNKTALRSTAVSVVLIIACEKEQYLVNQISEIEITEIACLTDNVTIGRELYPKTKGEVAMSDSYKIYEPICHELAHASHFQQLGKTDFSRCSWWADVFDYELGCILESGDPYGDATSGGNGPCGVTEMWAHTMGYYLSNATYGIGTSFPKAYKSYWFKPDALWDLITNKVITCKQAADCLKPEIKSVKSFADRLINTYPTKKSIIENAYK